METLLEKRERGGTSKAYAVMLLLLPLVEHIRILSFSSQFLFCSIFLVLPIFNKRCAGKLSADPWMLIYFLYALANLFVFTLPQERFGVLFVKQWATLFVTFFGYYVIGRQILDKPYFIRGYKIICALLTFAMIAQFVCGLAGHPFSMLPAEIPLSAEMTSGERFEELKRMGRYSTIFIEPAHQIQYVMPCIIVSLFGRDERERKKLWFPILLSIGVIATTSMQGILGLGIMWAYYFHGILRKGDKKALAYVVLLSPFVVAGLSALISSPVIQEQFDKKISNLEGLKNHYYDTSLFLRVLCGWFCYHDFPLFQKLFGCGYGNVVGYLTQTGIAKKYYVNPELIGYMNGMSFLLCQMGIVGFALFFAFFRRCLPEKKTPVIKALLLWWFVVMLTSKNLDSPASVIPMLLMFTAKNHPVRLPKRIVVASGIPRREASLQGGGAT